MRNRHSFAVLTGLLALGACIAIAPVASIAARPKALSGNGTIKVTVKDEGGNPASGVIVSVLARAGRAGPATQPATQPAANAARALRAHPVAEGVTDANGQVVLTNVPFGAHTIVAREKKVGAAHERVVLTSTTPLQVTLNLKKGAKKA